MTQTSILHHALAATSIMLLSCGLTWAMLRWVRVMDAPNARSSHHQPVPRSGGIAIVLATFTGIGLHWSLGDESLLPLPRMLSVWGGLLLMTAMALSDDVRTVGVRGKLLMQVLASIVVVISGISVRNLDIPFIGPVDLGLAGDILTVLWLVSMTNAFNFMDGIDGIAGGQAVIAGLFLAVIAAMQGSHFVFVTSYIVAAASAGFLVFNFAPARIFMGDTGSQFLGFTFGVLGVAASQFDLQETTILIVPILFFSFLWDTAFTLVRRGLSGQPVVAHRTHLYQLVCQLGWGHRRTSWLYYGFALLQGGLAMAVLEVSGWQRLTAFLPLVAVYSLFSALVVTRARHRGLL